MTRPASGTSIRSHRTLLLAAGLVLLYIAAEVVSRPHGSVVPALHPWAAGAAFGLALLTRGGPGMLPLALAGALAAALARYGFQSPLLATWSALTETIAVAISALLLRRPTGDVPNLERVRSVGRFFAVVVLMAALIAVPAALAASIAGAASTFEAVAIGARQLLSTAVAGLLVAPALIMIKVPRRAAMLPALSIETLLQTAALSVIAWEVFGRFVNEEIHFFYLLFLPVAWIATRHGHAGVAAALAAIFIAPLVSDWIVPHQEQAILELQIRLVVLAMTTLLLGAMVGERRRSEARMLARQAELAHVQRLNIGWEMASALAHEINQPLTAAMNYTQAAMRMLSANAGDVERASRVMGKSVDQIERVGRIINGLRDFMRKGELTLAAVDIATTFEDALRLVNAEATAAGVDIQASDLGGLPRVLADKTQLVQVVVNLVRNAIQALSAAATREPAIEVAAITKGAVLELTVSDNGPGLDEAVAGHLFEPFVTTKDSGMGLGLSISKSIVEAHGGQLYAHSVDGGGMRFIVVLPLASQETPDA